MDTKPLERFATWARRELISVVDAQASTVLAKGSVPRTEHPDAVRRLESEIENHGRQHIIDKVAYTWFNRIIALRFMDVRGYTDAGVVSPVQGQEDGQPEILSDAKRGNLDSDVITSKRTEDAILGLIDGTRHSTDAEGEAYAILLTEYCRYWHKFMPFMFEREGDYTELLVPVNLLADGAILSRAREALTEVVCEDVEVIGWIYQFYISERKQEIFNSKAKRGADEIPAATQLFTPHWIVRYLVENSLGRLWMLNRPGSKLVDQMDYYIAPVKEESDFLVIKGPEELTVIDPACGSGHMLTYAFDLLYAIYEEEGYAPSEIPRLILTHNLHGTEIDPRAGSLAAFALSMKARSKQRTFFSRGARPKICVIDPISFDPNELDLLVTSDGDRQTEEAFWNQFRDADTLGALIQPNSELIPRLESHVEAVAEDADLLLAGTVSLAKKAIAQAQILQPRYSVVVANPPYMGSARMDGNLANWLKVHLPLGKSGLDVAFWQRSMSFLFSGGRAGLVTMQSWMFLATYVDFRAALLDHWMVCGALHLGTAAFPEISGEVVGTVAAIMAPTRDRTYRAAYVRLTDSSSKQSDALRTAKDEHSPLRFDVSLDELATIPRIPIAYWMGEAERKAFGVRPSVATVCQSGNGLTSSDNDRFLRFWWEVGVNNIETARKQNEQPSRRRWHPINKGGGFRRWSGNRDYVVDWDDDGRELLGLRPASTVRNPKLYFQQSVSWSDVVTGPVSFRYYPEGWIFDASANSLFPTDDDVEGLLSFANSSFAGQMAPLLNPGLHFKLGDMGSLPYLKRSDPGWREEISELIDIAQQDWDSTETGFGFVSSPLLRLCEDEDLGIAECVQELVNAGAAATNRVHELESKNNAEIASQFDLDYTFAVPESIADVTLIQNLWTEGKISAVEASEREIQRIVIDFVSYTVGCMFGRYSPDTPGLILADQDATLQDYLERVPDPTFKPDADNVIPFVDDGWFEDDVVERFRQFLRVVFGSEHFVENLRFIEESLGVKSIRDYFITSRGKSKFYKDHVQRYKKRPIYWMFSSPEGSFNALIYIHRHNPSTVSTMLNEYLREYRAKLEVALADAENAAAGGSVKDHKEADRLRRVLVELGEYEHDVLYPLATRQLPLDLDDGVLLNYLRFGRALKDIGLENNRKKVEDWDWPTNKLEPL